MNIAVSSINISKIKKTLKGKSRDTVRGEDHLSIDQIKAASMEAMNVEVPCINTSEIMKALKGMSRGKAGGEDGFLID